MKFKVFKGNKQIVVVSESGTVYDESISPKIMEEVGAFEADGISDFNWGMAGNIIEHGQSSAEKDEAIRINENGL